MAERAGPLWEDGGENSGGRDRREKSGVACDTRDVRYCDWDCLRFWFRSVEQNAPMG